MEAKKSFLLEHADQGSKSFDSSSFSLDFESYAAMLSYFQEIRIEVDCFAEFCMGGKFPSIQTGNSE